MKPLVTPIVLVLLFVAALPFAAVAAPPPAPPPEPAHVLTIETAPPDAEVTIDRKATSRTPAEFSLKPGQHLVVLKKEGFRTEYRTVTIDEAVLRTPLRLDLDAIKGLLLADSSPSGADVTVDDLSYGRSPCLVTTLPTGVHKVTYTLAGYRPKTVEVNLDGHTPVKAFAELISDTATLHLTCEIEGVQIQLNGIPRDPPPCTIDRIPAGNVVLEATAEGYEPYTQIMQLAEGEEQNVAIALKRKPAILQVVSLPDKSRVYVDNDFRGETPLELKDLALGEHRVRVEHPGHDPNARTVNLEAGKRRVEEFRLQANTGRLLLTTEPDGVTVIINGAERGKTAAAEGQGIRASAPFAVENLDEGQFALKLVRPGFYEASQPFEVKRGETTTIHIALKRRFIPNYEVVTPTGVRRGVLDSLTKDSIRLETAPGIFSVYNVSEIISHRRLPDSADGSGK